MKNNNDSIKQENRKAFPKFVLMGVGGMILGAILGYALVSMDAVQITDSVAAAGAFFTVNVSPWLLLALPVVELAVCLPIYFGAKKQTAAWDGEDELVSNVIEAKLSVCMWITGMAIILNFFLLAGLFSGFWSAQRTSAP